MPAESPLTKLAPRAKLTAPDIAALIADMRHSIQSAKTMDYFARMLENHDARACYWENQSPDGRKWPVHESRPSRLNPGVPNDDIFPWDGASDTRVRLIDTVIKERTNFKRLALQRRQERVGPRDMNPDDNAGAKSALWGQVMNYYDDIASRNMRTASAQFSDIAEEYGHSILYVGWKEDAEVVEKQISPNDLTTLAIQAALQLAQMMVVKQYQEAGGTEEPPQLTPEEQALITQQAGNKLADMVEDEEQRPMLAAVLLSYDPAMPKAEATRVAKALRYGEPVDYYATATKDEQPEWRALKPFVDVFYPATTTRIESTPWVAMPEWVEEAELRSRVDTMDYDEAWVEAVIKKGPGRSLNLIGMEIDGWVLSNGSVRCALDQGETRFQIIHIYYRATAIGNVRALYHTVLHGQVDDVVGFHECCEHAHGKYPFTEHLTEVEAPYLLHSRGAGELTFTYVNEVKAQRDMRCDLASITIKPPFKVPLNQAGARINIRPGAQIPMRATAGMGMLEPMQIGADPRGSLEVENTTMDSFNEFWCRGMKVDPEVKLAHRQMMVSDFLSDILAAKLLTFALCQEFAADELKATFVAGLQVNLAASREEIQGRVSMELDFDVTELDQEMLQKRMQSLSLLMGMDNAALMLRPPLLKALTASLLPASYRLIVADPGKQQQSEVSDEQNIITQILNGTQFDEESTYQQGLDNATRLQVLQKIFGFQMDNDGKIIGMQPLGKDGQPTRTQSIFQEDPDVQARVANRAKFHAFQLAQQQNAQTGKMGVSPVSQ